MNDKPLSASVVVVLGLTGALTSAVSCGPCLKIAPPDTGDDTGDTGDTAEEDHTPAADSREAAAAEVLRRGVLPEDVVEILARRMGETE